MALADTNKKVLFHSTSFNYILRPLYAQKMAAFHERKDVPFSGKTITLPYSRGK